jgi:hypothetical protein
MPTSALESRPSFTTLSLLLLSDLVDFCELACRVKPSHISSALCLSAAGAHVRIVSVLACALPVCRGLSCAHARTRSARQHTYSTPVCSRARRLCTREKKCDVNKINQVDEITQTQAWVSPVIHQGSKTPARLTTL